MNVCDSSAPSRSRRACEPGSTRGSAPPSAATRDGSSAPTSTSRSPSSALGPGRSSRPSRRRSARLLACPSSRSCSAPLRYRETRSVAMLVLADEHGRAERLALALWERLERLGVYEREARPLASARHRAPLPRRGRGSARRCPRFPPFSPSDAAVYHSVLAPSGARYEVLESVPLVLSQRSGEADSGGSWRSSRDGPRARSSVSSARAPSCG